MRKFQIKALVWNVDKARPAHKRPLAHNRAGVLADLLERRTGDHMVVVTA